MISAEHTPQAKGLQLAAKLQQALSDALDEQVKVILFGSQSRGDAVEDSDIRFSFLPGYSKRRDSRVSQDGYNLH